MTAREEMAGRLLFLYWLWLVQVGVSSYEVEVEAPPCPAWWEWDQAGDRCYAAGRDTFTLVQAKQHCINLQGRLADAGDKSTAAFLRTSDMLTRPNVYQKAGYWMDKPRDSSECSYLPKRLKDVTTTRCEGATRGFICVREAHNVCPKKRCQHKCIIEGPLAARCQCPYGYQIDSSGGKNDCIDIDECKKSNGCDQICMNQEGHYNCSCFEGFNKVEGEWDECIPVFQMGMASEFGSLINMLTTTTIVATTIPVACIIAFVGVAMRLRILNQQVEQDLKAHEETTHTFARFSFDGSMCRFDSASSINAPECSLPKGKAGGTSV